MKLHLPVLLRKALLACFSFVFASSMGSGSAAAADLSLGSEDALTIDYAVATSIRDLENGTLQLKGDTILLLSNCGSGDGKTYTLLTGVSGLQDAAGNELSLDASNNDISSYFDTTQPGAGFWAGGTLMLDANGNLLLVRHSEHVITSSDIDGVTRIASRQDSGADYRYYKGVSFENLGTTGVSYGGAIYGGSSSITLNDNGSVSFSENTASSGGAIDGLGNITLSANGSVSFSENTASSNGGAIDGYGNITLSSNGSVSFSGNTASSHGGAISGRSSSIIITLNDNGSVSFSGNTTSSHGGAIAGLGNITLSANGSVSFSENTASFLGGAIHGWGSSIITLNDNGSVSFIGNKASSGGAIKGLGNITLSANGSVSFSGNTASDSGGAIHGDGNITLSSNGSVSFIGNKASSGGAIYVSGEEGGLFIIGNALGTNENGSLQKILFENNEAKGESSSGGAIVAAGGSALKINNNGEVSFSGNTASVSGGALHKQYGVFSIQNNTSVIFENNYTLIGNSLRLQSIRAYDASQAGDEMVVNFSAPGGGKIEFRDGVEIDVYNNSASVFNLNAQYTDEDNKQIAQTGDIIFTGAYATAENLNAILQKQGLEGNLTDDSEAVLRSRTSVLRGVAHLYDGRLIIRDGAIWDGDPLAFNTSSSAFNTSICVHGSISRNKDIVPTLMLQSGGLSTLSVNVDRGAALRLAGCNTASKTSFSLADASSLMVDVSAVHASTAALTLTSGSLSLSGSVNLILSRESTLSDGESYMLISGVGAPTGWSKEHVSVTSGTEGWKVDFDDLNWVGNTLWLYYDTRPDLVTATWTNESTDGKWNTTSLNWEQEEVDYAYKDGVQVVFGDEGAGTVTLVGTLTPASVLVNSTGYYSFEGSGSLSGGMTLTKQGSGTLSISTANSYTGGTMIEAGTVVAKHATALGTGTVTLAGGTLEIAVTGVGNTIANTGTSTLKVANGRTHGLTGTIANSGELTFSGVFQTSGLGALSTREAATFVNAVGLIDSTGGFGKSAVQGIQLTTGSGTTVNGDATIWHGTDELTLGSDGWATKGGNVSYGSYYIGTGHEVELSAIVNKAAENRVSTTNIQLNGGKLTANTALTGTLSISGTSELHGVDFNLGSAPLQNSGEKLTLTGSFDASGLSKSKEWNSYVTADNALSTDGSGFLREGDFEVIVVAGSGAVDNSGVTEMKYGTQNLTMTGGIGTGVGEMQYDTYRILSGHTASSTAIHAYDAGKGKNALITLVSGGTLNADDAVTETMVSTTGGSINLSAGTLSGTVGGSTIVTVSGTATMSGDNSYTGGTTLNSAALTVTHANALGTGGINTTGESSLSVEDVTLVLGESIVNTGELTLSGSFDASSLSKSDSVDVYVDVAGNETVDGSGFTRSGDFTVTIANGTVDSTGAIVSYKGTTLVMTGGVGLSKGGMLWGEYRILTGHEVELSAIVNKAAENRVSTTNIQLNGGKLTANTALTGTLSISGTSELHGVDFNLGSAPLQNNGEKLTLTGSFDASGLSKSKEWNRYVTADNALSTDGSGFLREGDFEVTVVAGSGSVDSSGVTEMKYGTQNLTMAGGIGTGVGEMQYDTYRILSGHTASSTAIHAYDAGKGKNALITLVNGGTLNADDAVTETMVSTTGGSINLSAGTLSGTVGGSTIVTVSGTATMSGDNSYTGGTTLNSAALMVTHANALGTGGINTTGESSLSVEDVTLVLGDSISNTGELTLSGSFDASGLTLNRTEEGRLGLDGTKVSLAESGFARGVEYSVQIVEGGTTVNDGASISHKDYLSRTQLVLGADGVARAGGAVDYTHFFLTGGDSAVVGEIADVATQHQETLTGVTMDSGELEVDRSIAVNATGGSIDITKAATLSGSIEDTAVSTAAGDYSSEIAALLKGDTTLEVNGGAVTVSGDNSYSGGTVVNGGSLLAGHDKAFGTGDVAVNGATLDLNRFTIANKVLMNGNSTLGHADGAAHIVLGGGSKVNFRDGYTLSAGKVLEVASPGATYTGALTLGGGTLELDGLLTVQGDVTFESGTQTTIDISGWNGADDGEVLATLGSSNSGYTEESLKLAGIAGDWELDFDVATGVLTLVAVKDEPLPEPEFNPNLNRNQQIVYDTIKDIMGEGNPGGLLGELGKEVTGTRDEEKLKQLLDELGGAEYATLLSGQQAAARGHMRRLRGEMGCGHLLAGSKTRAYIEAYNHRSEVDGDAHGRGYELNESGGQFALEFLGEDSVSGGFAVAAGRSKLQPDGGMTQKSDNTYVDAFVMHRDGAYTGKFSLGVGVHKYDLDRRVAGNVVSADTTGSSVNFMHESAWAMSLSESHSVQVFGAVESSFNRLGAFHEEGADTASLQVESQDAWVTTLSLGARYLYSFAALESAPAATLSLQGGLELDFGDTDSEVEMNFEGARSHSFRQSGAERDTFGYNLGASLHLPVSAKAAIYASGDAVLRGDSYEVNANVGLQMAF